jgi:dolichyl-diphosphooligosaccharide--protein glycosyltransferase
MVDWKLAYPLSGKFSAPTAFYDNQGYPTDAPRNTSINDLYRPVYNAQTGRLAFTMQKQRHYENMRTRLYKFHGSRVDAQPVVVDYDTVQGQNGQTFAVTPTGENVSIVRQFDSMQRARQFVEEDGTAQVGGIGRFPSEDVRALEHYRLVRTSEATAYRSVRFQRNAIRNMRGIGVCQQPSGCIQTSRQVQANSPQWVKAFERVEGATAEGTGPANTTVTASVEMRSPAANSTFTYRQQARTDENGQFTMTLPYATTGYDEWGTEEGYTNVSVRATGPYRFSTSPRINRSENFTVSRYQATADVSEAKVVGEDQEPVTVSLQEVVISEPQGNQSQSAMLRPPARLAG